MTLYRPTVAFGVRMDINLHHRLKVLCAKRRETMMAFVEKAIAARLGQLINANAGRLGKMRRRVDITAPPAEPRRRSPRATLEAMWTLPTRDVGPTHKSRTKTATTRCSYCQERGHYAPRCPRREAEAHGDGA